MAVTHRAIFGVVQYGSNSTTSPEHPAGDPCPKGQMHCHQVAKLLSRQLGHEKDMKTKKD